jgi:FtsH-binding integral membrane protein
MQNVNYIDQLSVQAGASKGLIIAVLACMFLLLVGLRLAPEDSTPLTAKVLALLGPTIAAGSFGAYVGRRISGWLPIIGLFLLSMVGLFIVNQAGGGDFALIVLLGWAFIFGMILGPLVGSVLAEEGPQIIVQALIGTTGIMMIAAFIALASGINFSFLLPILFLGLIGLIIAGLVGIFVRFSRTVNLTYSIIGIVIFSGLFLYDFYRVGQRGKTNNTWQAAIQLTTSLYLDFANLFIYILRFLAVSRRR